MPLGAGWLGMSAKIASGRGPKMAASHIQKGRDRPRSAAILCAAHNADNVDRLG